MPIAAVAHEGTRLMGSVVGFAGMGFIVVPAASLAKLTMPQLALTIARQLEAVPSSSRTRGMLLSFCVGDHWIHSFGVVAPCLRDQRW